MLNKMFNKMLSRMLDNVHRNVKQNVQTNAEHGQNFQNCSPPHQKKRRGTGGPRPAAGHSGTAEAKEF